MYNKLARGNAREKGEDEPHTGQRASVGLGCLTFVKECARGFTTTFVHIQFVLFKRANIR
jgi:hypothetical protein